MAELGAQAIWDDLKAGPISPEAEDEIWARLDAILRREGVIGEVFHDKQRHPYRPFDSFPEDFQMGWELNAWGETDG